MGLETALQDILGGVTRDLDVGSSAVFVTDPDGAGLTLVASTGLGDAAAAGLVGAVANPGHPIARTIAVPVATFDVLPTNPGGPALRSHVPLTGRDGLVVGVLALAHDHPLEPDRAQVMAAADDLSAAIAQARSPA